MSEQSVLLMAEILHYPGCRPLGCPKPPLKPSETKVVTAPAESEVVKKNATINSTVFSLPRVEVFLRATWWHLKSKGVERESSRSKSIIQKTSNDHLSLSPFVPQLGSDAQECELVLLAGGRAGETTALSKGDKSQH